jgi:thymidylate synthase (FAD)
MTHNNEVQLLGFYGSDQTHCLSAWQSTSVELGVPLPDDIQKRIEFLYDQTVIKKAKSPKDLLSFLAIHKHETPFEKSCIHFQVCGDIASHIHLIKHRIGVSINAESARYKEYVLDKYYLPEDWDEEERIALEDHTQECFRRYHAAIKRLVKKGMSRSRAKESARYYLGYALQLNFDVLFNFRSFMHFLSLRYNHAAQREIRMIAENMLNQVKAIPDNPFQYSLQAFDLE